MHDLNTANKKVGSYKMNKGIYTLSKVNFSFIQKLDGSNKCDSSF